ncbi:MAG: tyrosine-protein phosphatase [Chloroflexi bacterium]|nr:tyrosine-protein phosphatase [Chloroflexota bacterium]
MAHLSWDACYNARDVGGLRVAGGGRIRPRALIRSDILARLTPAGKQALIDYGVKTVIDLRAPEQVAEEPSAFSENSQNPTEPLYHILPLENRDSPAISQIDNAPNRAESYGLMLDNFQPEVAAIVRAVANAEAGGVLLHCHAGKDRTGVVIALLLGLVGVSDGEIAADYAASEERLWPLFRRMEAAVAGDPAQLAALQSKIPTASPETILAVLAHLRQRYGGVYDYLLAAGLTEDELGRIRRRLIEEV